MVSDGVCNAQLPPSMDISTDCAMACGQRYAWSSPPISLSPATPPQQAGECLPDIQGLGPRTVSGRLRFRFHRFPESNGNASGRPRAHTENPPTHVSTFCAVCPVVMNHVMATTSRCADEACDAGAFLGQWGFLQIPTLPVTRSLQLQPRLGNPSSANFVLEHPPIAARDAGMP